jgi:hypothetical protein
MLLLEHTAPTHSTPQGLVGWARASEGRREEENRPYGGEERSLEVEEKRGTGGTSDDKRRRAD